MARTTEPIWTAVDDYLAGLFVPPDPALEAALAASVEAGMPQIHVSPVHGKLLHLLARTAGARTILEIGTLAGYSTIWLARALPPGGRLVSLEADPKHADVARANIARAGLSDRVDVRLGAAADTLARMVDAGEGPFDFTFIDADKPGYPDYLRWSLALSRPGSVIVADNVVRDGAVADAASPDANAQAARRFNALLAAEPRVRATVLQTVGAKGYDGLAIAQVVEAP